MASFCPTCGLDFDNCPTCECPDDAKCLMLCEQMHGGKCPQYPYSDEDEDSEEKNEKDDDVWIEVNYIGSLYSAQMVQCKKSDSVLDLKEKLTDFNDIGVDQQKIIFKNKDDTDKAIVLGDDITVGEILVKAGEKESCRLQLICSLEGGGKILILSWKSCSINLSFFM